MTNEHFRPSVGVQEAKSLYLALAEASFLEEADGVASEGMLAAEIESKLRKETFGDEIGDETQKQLEGDAWRVRNIPKRNEVASVEEQLERIEAQGAGFENSQLHWVEQEHQRELEEFNKLMGDEFDVHEQLE